ncbi:MAG TPA: phosphoenolpyruvate--protein phosphotransferase [Candidatus Limnocylindrales bacterium]|nr:phosphoenolpyruvate--protein phosphotransferase [Candidatus Limnocylindrales bacterium]
MHVLRGVGAAPGVARGPAVRIDPPIRPAARSIVAEEVARERERLAQATEVAAAELEAIAASVRAQGHPDEAAIFEAQAAIARDQALAQAAEARIGEGAEGSDAIGAVLAAADSFADQLRGLGDEILAARAADVIDVGTRIATILAGGRMGVRTLDRPSIVVADDLPPSMTASLPRDRLLGLALEGSSPTAHAAILARAYAIPAVVGVRGLLDATAAFDASHGAEVALDGATGEVVVAPDEAAGRRFERRADEARRARARDVEDARLPAETQDATAVTLLANIGTPDEAAVALELEARGVGLFRTEFLFLERSSPPSEAEQVDAYRRVVEAFRPHPVTIRLLDVGGDKPIPYLPIPAEANPFLGVRALRLAATKPDVFVRQLRAAYRAATAGPVKVMAPMVADAGDATLLLDLAARARTELHAEGLASGDVALGVMLEIPSAILVADSYFGSLAFASLGTNDLLQYTLAVDRGNPALESYRDSLHPAVLRLIAEAVAAARRSGVELSVCGEMAGDPVAALALVGLGVRSLSMAASSLPGVRRAIRAVNLATLEDAAAASLDDPSAERVRARFSSLLGTSPV